MKEIRLSFRLRKALSFVPAGAVVLDVGSDRGDFLLALEKEGHVCYGAENKEGPYRGLVENLQANGSSAIPLFQDGLSSLPDGVDCLTLLGMGGKTIAGILQRAEGKLQHIQHIIVSPQSCFQETIGILDKLGYVNVDGVYVFERHYYPILLYARGTEEKMTTAGLNFGPAPIRKGDDGLRELIQRRLSVLRKFNPEGRKSHLDEERMLTQCLSELGKEKG